MTASHPVDAESAELTASTDPAAASAVEEPPVRTEAKRDRRSVWIASVMFAAVCLGMLTLYRPFVAADELFQFDRVMAASNGIVVVDPGGFKINTTTQTAQAVYVDTYQRNGDKPLVDFQPIPRDDRPTVDELGGDASHYDPAQRTNYISQHPPAYYLLMGILKNQVPSSDEIPADQLIFWLRFFNVLMLLPLPYLFFAAMRRLVGSGQLARAAAFLPLILPGLARSAASINNDNLAILAGSILLVLLIRVVQGDSSRRTAILVSLAALVGVLSKATVLPLLAVVVLAYAVQWWRARKLSPTPTMIVLILGGLATVAWFIRLKIVYGSFQPSGMAEFAASSSGQPRTAAKPFEAGAFFEHVWTYLPGRFWANLGILEPPSLTRWLLIALTVLVVLALVLAVILTRGLRLEILVLASGGFGLALMVVAIAFQHNQKYLSIPGLQGRYAYPAVLGMLLPIVFVLRAVLGRQQRWAQVILAVVGGAVSVSALWKVVQYYWMPPGEAFNINTLNVAFHYIGGWGTWPSVITFGLCGLVVLGLSVPLVFLVLDTLRTPSGPPAPIIGVPRAPRTPSGAPVEDDKTKPLVSV